MEKIQKKIIKSICICLILIATIFAFRSSVVAVEELVNTQTTGKTWGSTKANMPENNFDGDTGLFTQDYSGPRNIYMDKERFNILTNKWKATMSSGIVYCSDFHAYVRYASYDKKTHYLYKKDTPGGYKTVIQNVDLTDTIPTDWLGVYTVQEQYDRAINIIKEKHKNIIGKWYYAEPEKSSEVGGTYTAVPLQIHPDDQKKFNNLSNEVKQALSFLKTGISDTYDDDTINSLLESQTSKMMESLFDELAEEMTNTKTKDTSTNEKTAIERNDKTKESITGVYGPKIVVMESGTGNSDGYTTKKSLEAFNDSKLSFIFTACEEAYNKDGSYAQKYTLNDIQSAYWLAINQGEGPENEADPDKKYPTGKVTPGGQDLYDQAGKYKEFDGKFSAKINSAKAQVIADRENKYYIVGPYSIDYTYYEDIAYMKSLSINDILIYDLEHKDSNEIELILDKGKGSGITTGANGISLEFPKPNQNFFVKFKATDKTGFPSVTLNARFEYISDTKVEDPTLLTAQANEYQYNGYCKIGGTEYNALEIKVRWRIDYREHHEDEGYYEHYDTECLNGKFNESTGQYNPTDHSVCSATGRGEWIEEKRSNVWYNIPEQKEGQSDSNRWKVFTIYVPYIKLNETPVSRDAQELFTASKAEREYTVVNKSITIPIKMELGGTVWEDEEGGKESISNGIKDSKENGVPNVKVTLSNGAGTKTNKNGEYKFYDLDPMEQYSVTFTYNGQYYQPTTYSDASTWGISEYEKDEKGNYVTYKDEDGNTHRVPTLKNWKTNSNATDIRLERIEYNEKFQSIGSSPANYKSLEGYNQTFTKYQLMGYVLNEKGEYVKSQDLEPVIDSYLDCQDENHKNESDHNINCYKTYGNLILSSSSNTTTQAMIQYVKDCMINAYTGINSPNNDKKEGFKYDLYPYPSIFVIDSIPVGQEYIDAHINNKGKIPANPAILYDNAYFINLGLVHREETDLAVNKDVEKVTLEINGQVHEYTYDHIESALGRYHCDNCKHEGENKDLLNVNRQLKCPNCEFKCSNCNYKGIAKELVSDANEYGREIQKCPKCESTNIEQKDENIRQLWDINVRLSDAYYDASYSREIYKSDYLYKASMYKGLKESKEGELEVYITYKIMVRNQAMSIQTRVDELVDYYDQDLRYVDERSYIEIKRGKNNVGKYSVQADYNETTEDSNSKYGKNTRTTIEGYNNLYIRGLGEGAQKIVEDEQGNVTKETLTNGIYLEAGQTAYLYLTFNVKKDNVNGEDWVRLDEIIETGLTEIPNTKKYDVGKENIVEINGYSTIYAKGTYIPNVYSVDKNGNVEIDESTKKPKLKDVGGMPAGIVDKDSNPGNLSADAVSKNSDYENKDDDKYHYFEDDTDKAPNIRIKLNRDDNSTRVISGSVWEDTRTQEIAGQATVTGDGYKDEKSTLINGVTVQLVELMEDGRQFVWREFGNIDKTTGLQGGSGLVDSEYPIINAIVDGNNIEIIDITADPTSYAGKTLFIPNYEFEEEHDGAYAFKSFMPGKYVVKFIYGDTEKTILPDSLGGKNVKSYNGQDYKSTAYQQGVSQDRAPYIWREDSIWNNGKETQGKVIREISTYDKLKCDQNEIGTYLYDITESEKYNGSDEQHQTVSDAKDIESIRNNVNRYSEKNVTNYIAEVLASHKADYNPMNTRETLLKDLMDRTKMTAVTGVMVIELEYDSKQTDKQKENNTSTYKIQNVDLGLEERPKAGLAIDKEVTNVKLALADGSILFDAKNTATNLLWRDHKAYFEGSTEGKMEVYNGQLIDTKKLSDLEEIRKANSSKFGLIQLSMDEELMHGATMEITYRITVANIGEVDYYNTYNNIEGIDRKFYYTGVKADDAKVVTTSANQVIDYVANNLQFNANNNKGWSVIKQDELIKADNTETLVNNKLKKQVEKYNTIIVTESLSKPLLPSLISGDASSTSVPLVLTQLITSENDTDDLTYRNIVEIVKTSNNVGRRMEYSVVGNQNPTDDPQELDSDIAEVVKILPPFGNSGTHIIVLIVSLATIAIITVGIILIKKKVLTK